MFSLAISSICDCWRTSSRPTAAATSGSAIASGSEKKSAAVAMRRGTEPEAINKSLAEQQLSGATKRRWRGCLPAQTGGSVTAGARQRIPNNPLLPYLARECQSSTINRVQTQGGAGTVRHHCERRGTSFALFRQGGLATGCAAGDQRRMGAASAPASRCAGAQMTITLLSHKFPLTQEIRAPIMALTSTFEASSG